GLVGAGEEVGVGKEEGGGGRGWPAAARGRIEELSRGWPGPPPLLAQLRETSRHRSEHVDRQRNPTAGETEDRELIEHREIRRTVLDAEREALLRLRTEGGVSDEVLRDLERELDLEERRMDA